MFKHMTKIQARLLLEAKGTFTEQTLPNKVADRFYKMYKPHEIRPEFQRFIECKFFEAAPSRSAMFFKLSESGAKIADELEAIAANPSSPYYELTQPSMSPNVQQL